MDILISVVRLPLSSTIKRPRGSELVRVSLQVRDGGHAAHAEDGAMQDREEAVGIKSMLCDRSLYKSLRPWLDCGDHLASLVSAPSDNWWIVSCNDGKAKIKLKSDRHRLSTQ